jgi:hypothetical protein
MEVVCVTCLFWQLSHGMVFEHLIFLLAQSAHVCGRLDIAGFFHGRRSKTTLMGWLWRRISQILSSVTSDFSESSAEVTIVTTTPCNVLKHSKNIRQYGTIYIAFVKTRHFKFLIRYVETLLWATPRSSRWIVLYQYLSPHVSQIYKLFHSETKSIILVIPTKAGWFNMLVVLLAYLKFWTKFNFLVLESSEISSTVHIFYVQYQHLNNLIISYTNNQSGLFYTNTMFDVIKCYFTSCIQQSALIRGCVVVQQYHLETAHRALIIFDCVRSP